MKISVVRVTQSLFVLTVPVMDGIQSPQIIFSWNSEVSLFVGYPKDQILPPYQYPHIP